MHTIKLMFAFGFAALAIWIAYGLWDGYRKAEGTTWQRLLSTARNSATMLWQKFCLLLAGLVGSLDSLADLAGLPEVKTYIELALGNPKVVAGVMVAVAVITLKARARTM